MDHQLRFWSLLQFLYDLRNFSGTDWQIIVEELKVTVATGHLNRRPFDCLEDDFPGLKSAHQFSVITLRDIAFRQLRRLAADGRRKSTFLGPYIEAQIRHLERCQRCVGAVCGHIADVSRLARISKNFASRLSESERMELVERFAPHRKL